MEREEGRQVVRMEDFAAFLESLSSLLMRQILC